MAATIGRVLCVLAAAAACAWVAAGASAATNPKRWVTQADKICTSAVRQQRAIPRRTRTVDQIANWLAKAASIERKALERIATLERPASMRSRIAEMVRSGRAAYRLVPALVRALRQSRMSRYLKLAKQVQRHANRANRMAISLGALDCARL